MSQPVKLSDELVLDARLTGELLQRSIARQVELWARIGRAIEPMLDGDRVLALCRSGAQSSLSERIASVDSDAGRRRVAEFLRERPYPHYEADPSGSGAVVRIDADGTRTVGRFVDRRFQPVTPTEA